VRPKSRLIQAARGKFGYLLVALIALMLSAPVMVEGRVWRAVVGFFTSAVLVAALYAAKPGRRSLVVGSALAGLDFLIGRAAAADNSRWISYLQLVLWLVTLTYVVTAVLEVVLEPGRVTPATLQAALCVYLLFGVIWAYLFALVELSAPGSFRSPGGARVDWSTERARRVGFMRLLVLSDSTLTGTGFNDLAPTGGLAIMIANLEAFTAQVYLAVVVARIVAAELPKEPAGQPDDPPPVPDPAFSPPP